MIQSYTMVKKQHRPIVSKSSDAELPSQSVAEQPIQWTTIEEKFVPEPLVKKHLCLNMIVKNESRVILRLLQSVAPYIDCYCICDTGSTDNTIEIIETFFEAQKIPGKIIREPFVDFGYNRTFSLKACEAIDVQYILLMDADMVLQVSPSITKEALYEKLTADAYYVFQGSETFFYKNVRIVRNQLGMTYWGVTHEYVRTPEGTRYDKMEKNELFINDIGDGGSKADKFIRDIQLLTRGLEQEPNNDRYTFYLANSYRDAGQYQNAIDTYKKRIAIGGWFDEVWHSYYSIGKCYKLMGDYIHAIHWWLEAYNYFPGRIENLYEIIHHYRNTGKNNLAYGIFLIADQERKKNKNTDFLFLQKDIYDYKLDYELSIVGYYCNYRHYDLLKASLKVLNYPFTEESISQSVLSNYKFYVKEIQSHNTLDASKQALLMSIGKTIPTHGFVSSTPSLCLNEHGEVVVNVRYVDYKINDQGGYENKEHITTKNVLAVVDITEENWVWKKEFLMNYNTKHDGLYVGIEDVRLFSKTGDKKVYYNANRGLSYHHLKVEHGILDMDTESTTSGLISMEGQREVEKNWVLFEDVHHTTKIVYNWSPLVIGNIHYEKPDLSSMVFQKTHEIKTPPMFKYLRGSSNGVRIGDEVWFICHTVSYEDRRYYYHLFVVLDASTYQVKKFTPYFTFEKEKVEYSLGFVYIEQTKELLIGYSLMDKETKYGQFPKQMFDDMMVTEKELME